MRISIVGTHLPGRVFCRADGTSITNVHVGIQRQHDPVELVGGDAAEARWDITVEVVDRNGSIDFRGPDVHGKSGERFVYLTRGEVGPADRFDMFRRAKVMLNRIEPELITAARASGTLVASIDLTGDDGGPCCARVDPPAIIWTVADG